ncbi:hypothetical protein JTB14_038172 [Gonioctena quinquepunctata]|nr:hypothetical protein JTB14_038172 [Gonioctena quinquepunctata]
MANTPSIEENYLKSDWALKEKYQEIMEELHIKIQNNQSIPPNNAITNIQWKLRRMAYLFRSVHENQNQSISKTGKLQYLKSQLQGDTQHLIKHLQIVESNYETAWIDTRLIIAKLLDKIIDFQNIIQESAHEIQQLHDVSN